MNGTQRTVINNLLYSVWELKILLQMLHCTDMKMTDVVHLQNGTEQLFTQSRVTAHLHGSLLSHNINNNTLAALQKISTEVIESHIQSLSRITKRKSSLGLDTVVVFWWTFKQLKITFTFLCNTLWEYEIKWHGIFCSVVLVVGSSVEPVAHQPPWPRDDSCWWLFSS